VSVFKFVNEIQNGISEVCHSKPRFGMSKSGNTWKLLWLFVKSDIRIT